jgi:flagellar biosynthesis/type III secretory pathway ATPase
LVIAAPADVSPLLRMQGAAYATRIAEDFRDRGQHVLLADQADDDNVGLGVARHHAQQHAFTDAGAGEQPHTDVIGVGLIGERGREVKDFIENILGAEGRARSVVIAAPADVSPLLRMQGAAV